jgi:hypothetical protein
MRSPNLRAASTYFDNNRKHNTWLSPPKHTIDGKKHTSMSSTKYKLQDPSMLSSGDVNAPTLQKESKQTKKLPPQCHQKNPKNILEPSMLQQNH